VLDTSRASAFKTAGASGTRQQGDGFDRGDRDREAWGIVRQVSHPFGIQEQRREVGASHRVSTLPVIDHSRGVFGGATAPLDSDRLRARKSAKWWNGGGNGFRTEGSSNLNKGVEPSLVRRVGCAVALAFPDAPAPAWVQ
jgi:hypothetical protein